MASSMVEEQLATIELLQAMYPLPEELELGTETSAAISDGDVSGLPSLDLVIRVPIDEEGDCDDLRRVEILVSLPLRPTPSSTPSLSPSPSSTSPTAALMSIRQPSFLSRGAYEQLLSGLPSVQAGDTSSEVVLAAVEYVRATTSSLVPTDAGAGDMAPCSTEDNGVDGADDQLERVWFWFPSLSTREKRRDLVEYALTYQLTGFVLAGKPGLLCVEGDGRRVDKYMAAIKSESWGDIPSHQKKVTERLRRPLLPSERKFTTMSEITHLIPQHGQYNHRGDMGEVKRLMDEWGVGDDFGAAVMNQSG